MQGDLFAVTSTRILLDVLSTSAYIKFHAECEHVRGRNVLALSHNNHKIRMTLLPTRDPIGHTEHRKS